MTLNKPKRKVADKPKRKVAKKDESVVLDGKKIKFKGGALHRQLGVPEDKTIPKGLMTALRKAKVGDVVQGHKVTALMKKRVNFAFTLMGKKK